jgi:hypothetical protein
LLQLKGENYWPAKDKEGWQIRYSYELYNLYNAPVVVKTVKLGRLKWLGHLTRANETSPCRKLTFSKPIGTRRAGRPNLRWLDSIKKDLRILGVRGWITEVQEGHGGGQDPVKMRRKRRK